MSDKNSSKAQWLILAGSYVIVVILCASLIQNHNNQQQSTSQPSYWLILAGSCITALATIIASLIQNHNNQQQSTSQPSTSPSTPFVTTSQSAAPSWLKNGKQIELKIQSFQSGWLDGKTREGKVAIADARDREYTGTRWKIHIVHDRDDRIIMLETLGHLDGRRWLDGGTGDGTVKLADSTEGTGIQWKVHVVDGRDDQIINLETLGHLDGRKWLYGRTGDQDKIVGLADSTGGEYTGTNWRVFIC